MCLQKYMWSEYFLRDLELESCSDNDQGNTTQQYYNHTLSELILAEKCGLSWNA
jgi:hypothetical protein